MTRLQICPLYIFGNKATDGPYGSKYWFPGFGFDSGPNLQPCMMYFIYHHCAVPARSLLALFSQPPDSNNDEKPSSLGKLWGRRGHPKFSQWNPSTKHSSNLPRLSIAVIFIELSPLPVRVTTRIITFLVGNQYKHSFPLLLGGGTTQVIFIHFNSTFFRLKTLTVGPRWRPSGDFRIFADDWDDRKP